MPDKVIIVMVGDPPWPELPLTGDGVAVVETKRPAAPSLLEIAELRMAEPVVPADPPPWIDRWGKRKENRRRKKKKS